MGAVYKATQDSLERPVAIKILPPELNHSESFRLSFEKEAKLMAKVNHPNLIGVYDFGEVDGMLYIVMEYVDGSSLFEHVNNATLDPVEALEVIRDICLGLGNAHEAGILHRDIKPANIFITSSGTPKIGDFGLARPCSATEHGVIFGTPGYAAPEVTAAPELVGPATDIFSVGVMLYEFLTAKLPEANQQPNCGSPEINTLINKAISADLAQRYQSAQDLVSDINALLVTLRTKAATAAKFKTPLAGQAQHSAPPTQARPLPQKKGTTLQNICIILVLIAAIFGALEWKKRKEAGFAETKAASANSSESLQADELRALKHKTTSFLKRLTTGESALDSIPSEHSHLSDHSRLVTFVDKELTWLQADLWCQQRGGYLASIHSEDDLAAIQPLIPDTSQAWIGAATSGNQHWSWTDGTALTDYPVLPSASKMLYAMVRSEGTVITKNNQQNTGFLIEWRLDNSQPATLEKRIDRLADSPQSFLPGTASNGNKNYYLCASPMSQSEATQLAQLCGAKLASPSDASELRFLQHLLQENIPAGQLCRLHSELNANHTSWTTSEPWTKIAWQHHQHHQHQYKDALAALVDQHTSWETIHSSQAVPYTLFEWSNDTVHSPDTFIRSQKQLFTTYQEARSKLNEPKKFAAKSIQQLEKLRDSQLRKNSASLISEIRILRKSLSKAQLKSQSPYLDSLLSEIRKSYRIPATAEDISAAPNKKMAATLTLLAKKEQRILIAHKSEIKQISDTYQAQMKAIISDFENNNLTPIADESKALLDQTCQSIETFTQFIL